MDSPPANDKAGAQKGAAKPSIDSLRTVEFRTTIRGYHMDDVDEYLERVAVEAEELQEQVRLSSDRIKQAVDRSSALEQQIEQLRRAQQSQAAAQAAAPAAVAERADAPADDSLQRTLLLAQKFVDQTRAEAESEARAMVAEAETRARSIVGDAEDHVRVMTEEAERNLRDEVKRLDAQRTELVGDVETIARHLEVERSRIRTALTEMLAWVDEHVQPPKSTGSSANDSTKPVSPSRERFARNDLAEAAQMLDSPLDKSTTKPDGDRNGDFGAQRVSNGGGILAGRSGSDDPGLLGGPPTELLASPATGGSDSSDDSGGSTGSAGSTRMASEKPQPAHQRQMFAPGRGGGTHHTESGVR
jgi:cell division initiation protein